MSPRYFIEEQKNIQDEDTRADEIELNKNKNIRRREGYELNEIYNKQGNVQ